MDSKWLKQAEALLAEGKEQEARELLLKAGYGKQFDKEAQEAFLRLFPPAPELQRHLEGPLKLLLVGTLEERRAAAKLMDREARGRATNKREAWLADPRTTGVLIQAAEDQDPEVVERVMMALGAITGRYFDDQRALPVALRLLKSKRKLTRLWALGVVSRLGGVEVYEQILPYCKDKAEGVRRKALGSVGLWKNRRDIVPEHVVQAFFAAAVGALKDPSLEVRMTAKNTLDWLGLPEAIEPLKQALAAETYSVARDNLEYSIRKLSEAAARKGEK